MNCKNCNGELPESAAFCPVCGQLMTESEGTGETKKEYMNFQEMNETSEGKPPKKMEKKKVGGIIVAAVLAVAVLIGATCHAQIGHFVKKTFSSPEQYYQYIETKNRDTGKRVFINYYDTIRQKEAGAEATQSAVYKVEFGQTLKTMMSMSGVDFSKLNDMEMEVVGKRSGNLIDGKLNVLLNGSDLCSMNMHMDYDAKAYYVQIPELSEKYLDYSSMLQNEENGEALAAATDVQKYLPETAVMDKLITTYTDLMIEQMDTVEKTDTRIGASGINIDCTNLNVTCKSEKLYAVLEQLLRTMKEDPEIRKYLEGIGSETYSTFTEKITEMLEDMEEGKETFVPSGTEAVMNVYVDSEGKILGRIMTLMLDGKTYQLTGIEPSQGNKFGYQFTLEVDGIEYFSVVGKGTRENGKVNGEYAISIDESMNPYPDVITTTKDMISIIVTDVDEETWVKDGYANGSVTISTEVIAPLASYALQFDSQGDEESVSSSMSIVCAGEKLLSLTATAKETTEDIGSMKPAEDAPMYDIEDSEAMAEYVSEMKAEEFLNKIKEIAGIDLTQYADVFRNMGESEEPSLEEYEYDLSDDYDLSGEDGPTEVIGFGL